MCHVVSMLVYCNCMTNVLCWSLVCCMSSCNGVHLIDYSVYLYTKERNKVKSVKLSSGLRDKSKIWNLPSLYLAS